VIKLNIGCGTDYREGWTNIDKGNVRCDIAHDIEVLPWPFEDSSIDEILMQHILEHVSRENFVLVVREMYRVCKSHAIIRIISPYAGSDNFWTDPTHKMPLTTRTFDYFDPSKGLHKNGKAYDWDDIKLSVLVGELKENKPNGPDVIFKLEVIK